MCSSRQVSGLSSQRTNTTPLMALLWLCLCCLLLPKAGHAKVYQVKAGDKLFDILKKLKAGDEVIVGKGTYNTPGFVTLTLKGTRQQPIVIRAAKGVRPLIKGVPNQNVMNLNGTYFTIRGFEITSGSHGLRLYKVAHIVLEDLKIHDLKSVGISCNAGNSDCDDVTIRRNEIYKTAGHGEGMYLGCNNAACVMRNSLIEQNYIHDLGGSQGDGIEIKSGSFGNVVRDNVIVNARYPAITMYGFKAAAGRKPNVVERNLIWKTVDNGIQIVGQVIVRNNIIVNAGNYGIQSKASQGFLPHDLQIVHNTVYNAKNACLKTNNWKGQTKQLVANNALYCPGKTAIDVNGGAPAAQFFGNVFLGRTNFNKGVTQGASTKADLGNPAARVFYPPSGSKLLNAGHTQHTSRDDFDGRPRSDGKPDVGAYERSTSAPAWKVVFGFKPGPGNTRPPQEPPPAEPAPEPPGSEPQVDLGGPGEAPTCCDTPDAAAPTDKATPAELPGAPDADKNPDASKTPDVATSPDLPLAEQKAGEQKPGTDTSGPGADGGPRGGCGCHAQAPMAGWLPWLLLLFAGGLGMRRKS